MPFYKHPASARDTRFPCIFESGKFFKFHTICVFYLTECLSEIKLRPEMFLKFFQCYLILHLSISVERGFCAVLKNSYGNVYGVDRLKLNGFNVKSQRRAFR